MAEHPNQAAMRSVIAMLLPDEHGKRHRVNDYLSPWHWERIEFVGYPLVREVTSAERAVIESIRGAAVRSGTGSAP